MIIPGGYIRALNPSVQGHFVLKESFKCLDCVALPALDWVAVKELKISYHNPETILFDIQIMVTYTFLNSHPVKACCLEVLRRLRLPKGNPGLYKLITFCVSNRPEVDRIYGV